MKMNVLRKVLILLAVLKSLSKVLVRGPSRCDIVIFDLQEDLVSLFGNLRVAVFDPRYTQIHLAPFLAGVLRWVKNGFAFSLTHHYFLSFLASSRPKVVITVVDNNSDLYSARLAIVDKDLKFIVFQNGSRFISDFPKKPSLRSQDTFFCLTSAYVSPLKETVAGDARVIPSGTLAAKLNEIENGKNSSEKSAGFISNWLPGQVLGGTLTVNGSVGNLVPHATFYKPEIELLPHLLTSTQRLGMTLEIIGRSDSAQEYAFYESILGEAGWSFSPRVGNERSYAKLALHTVLFAVDSTLGYEALSGLKRVMFIDGSSGGGARVPFGYPSNLEFAGSVLHLRSKSFSLWGSQISKVLSMSDREFFALAEKHVGKASISMHLDEVLALVREDLG